MDLQLDDMQTDTKLAREYLEKNREFFSFGPDFTYSDDASTECFKFNIPDYNIFQVKDLENVILNVKTTNTAITETMRNLKFNELAMKIQDHSHLFVQLEYLLRNRPVEDTQLEMELLTKQLRISSSNNGYNILAMSTGASLLSLGCVASMRKSFHNIILATRATAVISYLFTKLCHEVGLNDFFLIITSDESIGEIREVPNYRILDYSKFTAANSWSLGVITEHSDVDSAVDVFLTCSAQCPWKLQKILVQENVYQQFKDALSWKHSLKGARTDDEVSSSYRKLCPDVFKFDDRIFLLDYIISTPPPQILPEVYVEAYRTTKELLSLLRKYEPFYLSLWSSDVAESNEIAHAVGSHVVWINGFADFRGPARISNTVYDVARTRLVKKTKTISELNKLAESWLKIEIAERRRILSEVIKRINETIGDSTDKINEFNDNSNSFVEVGKDYVCMGIARPAGIVEITSLKDSLSNGRILESILLGNAVVTDEQDTLVNLFEEAHVPVVYAKLEDGNDCKVHFGIDNVTKVIWSNVGTIFAN